MRTLIAGAAVVVFLAAAGRGGEDAVLSISVPSEVPVVQLTPPARIRVRTPVRVGETTKWLQYEILRQDSGNSLDSGSEAWDSYVWQLEPVSRLCPPHGACALEASSARLMEGGPPVPFNALVNGDFSSGLNGWTVVSGSVTWDAGRAVFTEHETSLLSTLMQEFTIPGGDASLSFVAKMTTVPGGVDDPFAWPDAFTASLLNPVTLDPLVASPGRTDLYYLDNTGVVISNMNLSGLAGQRAALYFDLIGSDDGMITTVTLGDVKVIPEPMTLLLVASGGVLLRRREKGPRALAGCRQMKQNASVAASQKVTVRTTVRRCKGLVTLVVGLIALCSAGASATTYYSTYKSSTKLHNIIVQPGTHYFQIDKIARYKKTEWYLNGNYTGETDDSGLLADDPEYMRSFSTSGSDKIEGVVYTSNRAYEETHTWNITVAQPDLVVTDITMNGSPRNQSTLPQVQPGQAVRLDFYGKNIGTRTSKTSIGMKWWWGTSQGAKTHEIDTGLLGTINGLAPGEEEEETDFSWTVPSTPGDYWITAKIDWDNKQTDEAKENNNERSERFTVYEPRGTINITVSGVSGNDRPNASILYRGNYGEQWRKDEDTPRNEPAPSSNSWSFTDRPYANDYIVDAYYWDMWVGEVGPFSLNSPSVSRTINALPKRPLKITVRYDNGVGIPGCDVRLSSWDNYHQNSRERDSGTTGTDGSVTFQAWPTSKASQGERYIVRAYPGGTLVENQNVTLANTSSGSSYVFAVPTPNVTISGYVRTLGGSGISGVSMTGWPGTAPVTSSNGYYSGTVPYGWSGTITPDKSGYSFSPASKGYPPVTSDVTQDYTGGPPISISGHVRDSQGNGISGVAMNGLPGTPVTDATGHYIAVVSSGWSGTVTPQKTGYEFTPASQPYASVLSSRTDNYTGSLLTFTITGYVRTSDGKGISGVTLSGFGFPGTDPVTNSTGYYSGTVHYGWSGTVTPQKGGYTFDPPAILYSLITSNRTNQNYTGSESWSFVHITDPHIGMWQRFMEPQQEADSPSLKETIKKVLAISYDTPELSLAAAIYETSKMKPKPDFILLSGDIADYGCGTYSESNYKDFVQIVKYGLDRGISLYSVPGNHDRAMAGLQGDCSPMLSDYRKYVVPLHCLNGATTHSLPSHEERQSYYFEHKGIVFVGLDSGGTFDAASLLPDQISDLRAELSDGKPKVVFMHHPALDKGDGLTDLDVSVKGESAEALREWCESADGNVQVVLAGHSHQDHAYNAAATEVSILSRDRPLYVQTPSAGQRAILFGLIRPLLPWYVRFVLDDMIHDEKGYRRVHVLGNQVMPQPYDRTKGSSVLLVAFFSPGTVHIYDSFGRHTGFGLDGEVEIDVPASFCFGGNMVQTDHGANSLPARIAVFDPCDDYLFQVLGQETAPYRLAVSWKSDSNEFLFDANGIATQAGAIHDYVVDWDAISRGEQGATLLIDGDGDGTYDLEIVSDANLTSEKYTEAHPVITEYVDIGVAMPGYDRRSKELSVEVTITNTSAQTFSAPLWLVIDSVSDPSIVPMDTNTPVVGGRPHVDFSDALSDGTLRPGQSVRKRVAFSNPQGLRFTFEPGVRGLILSSPQQPAAATLQGVLRQWLGADSSLDVAPAGGDGIVNFLDFAALAGRWIDD